MNEEFNSMRDKKRYRTKAIIEIISNHSVHSQEELVERLKEDFGIESNQSTVSRDIATLGLVKNEDTNCYQLGEVAKKEREKEELKTLLGQGEAIFWDTDIGVIAFKVIPSHAQLVATKLETFFSTDEGLLGTLVGPTGTIALLVSKNIEERVRKELNAIFE